MRALEEKIVKEGTVISKDILKVGCFLNQRIDVDFLVEMGKEIARLYNGEKISEILTIEASGIAIATALAVQLHVPVVFAKKSRASTQNGDVYTATVKSFTHGNSYTATVSKEFISKGEKVLIVDDFLAHGEALNGLISIVEQAGAEVVGCAVAIEKNYQGGGDAIRHRGYRVDALAKIAEMDPENGIRFC
ncbi:MAG: xanthine phosphoribosyltransferase [Clostridia bacterium]|nr:xanthine phosphoribosyltransferase [Clostridia bacterium]